MLTLNFHDAIDQIPSAEWNKLLDSSNKNPFILHEYLNALEKTECVSIKTGWKPCHGSIRDESGTLLAAMPLYLKSHSYGEYVFDWSWANAYKDHGLNYYPKLLSAIPFTPVMGPRILGVNTKAKKTLLHGIKEFAIDHKISSFHILFPNEEDSLIIGDSNFLKRESIQFHWRNRSPNKPNNKLESFDEFLRSLNKKRRNNILRERSSIRELGIEFEHIPGKQISESDWEHFYACYSNTYIEHGSSPYLNLDFFKEIGEKIPEHIHLIIASLENKQIASSLIFRNRSSKEEIAYGRYWGALRYIPNLHFETAYYQSIDFCINENISMFEGGAQGEHKIHRGMSPVNLKSAHYITDKNFSMAIENFLLREGTAITNYCDELQDHLPFKKNI